MLAENIKRKLLPQKKVPLDKITANCISFLPDFGRCLLTKNSCVFIEINWNFLILCLKEKFDTNLRLLLVVFLQAQCQNNGLHEVEFKIL